MSGEIDDRIKALNDLAWNWKGVVESVLKKKFNRRLFYVQPRDQVTYYRLLSLRTWTMQFKLPLEEILGVLLPFWDSVVRKYSRKPHKGQGLGCTIPALCGDKSQQILEEYVKKKYPGGENVRAWKQQKQDTYFRIEKIKVSYAKGVEDWVGRYSKQVHSQRRRNSIIETKKRKPRRRFPDNPWL